MWGCGVPGEGVRGGAILWRGETDAGCGGGGCALGGPGLWRAVRLSGGRGGRERTTQRAVQLVVRERGRGSVTRRVSLTKARGRVLATVSLARTTPTGSSHTGSRGTSASMMKRNSQCRLTDRQIDYPHAHALRVRSVLSLNTYRLRDRSISSSAALNCRISTSTFS